MTIDESAPPKDIAPVWRLAFRAGFLLAAAFATLGSVPKAEFRWTKGERELKSYTADNQTTRRFCQHCGSSMSFEPASNSPIIEISLGTLDTPIPYQPDVHIFTKFKADWYPIDDALPQFDQGRNNKATEQEQEQE